MIKIVCDNCESDLTYSMGGIDHCLVLKDRQFGPNSRAVQDYYMMPLLEEDKYFCGVGCLDKWIENKKKEKNNK